MAKPAVNLGMKFQEVKNAKEAAELAGQNAALEEKIKTRNFNQKLMAADQELGASEVIKTELKIFQAMDALEQAKNAENPPPNPASDAVLAKAKPLKKVRSLKNKEMLDEMQKLKEQIALLTAQVAVPPAAGAGVDTKANKQAEEPEVEFEEDKPKEKKTHIKHQPYKIDENGSFGKLHIDRQKLIDNRKLVVHLGNKRAAIMSKLVDEDLVDLLTKKLDTKRVYSNKSIDIFNKLIEWSELPINRLSKKAKLIKKKEGGELDIKMYASVDELAQRLMELKEMPHSKRNFNELNAILDKLVEDGEITKAEREKIYSQYIDN